MVRCSEPKISAKPKPREIHHHDSCVIEIDFSKDRPSSWGSRRRGCGEEGRGGYARQGEDGCQFLVFILHIVDHKISLDNAQGIS